MWDTCWDMNKDGHILLLYKYGDKIAQMQRNGSIEFPLTHPLGQSQAVCQSQLRSFTWFLKKFYLLGL